MEKTELLKIFQDAETVEALLPAYTEVRGDAAKYRPLLLEALNDLAAQPSALAEEARRRVLSHVLLLLGMTGAEGVYAPLLKLACAPEFLANVKTDDWLYCELSRLFGLSAEAPALPGMTEKAMDASLPALVREQLVMAMVYRWLAEKESDQDFAATVKRLLAELPEEAVSPELAMSLIINAVAVSGDSCREEVEAFYRAHAAKLKSQLPEKRMDVFFGLGRQRIKAMLRGNFLGAYTTPEHEVKRMLDFSSESEGETATPKVLPPITRDRPKVGRNDPCPCGSGKKYKHCCGK
jgi:hypothetical protein